MRSSLHSGVPERLTRSPNPRDQVHRIGWALAGGLFALVLAGGVAGVLTTPQGSREPDTHTGPFSYFPTE